MSKYKYTVEWEGDLTNYKQDFETLEEARIAMIMHHKRNAVIKVIRVMKRTYTFKYSKELEFEADSYEEAFEQFVNYDDPIITDYICEVK